MRAGAVALVLATTGACAGARTTTVIARGTLAYAAATDGDDLVTVELTERFALVVRRWDGQRAQPRVEVDLGPPEADVVALAIAPGPNARALVGGRDGWVRSYSLEDGAPGAAWPQGAAITALAADSEVVLAGDDTGVVCARRLADGALLVCADVGDGSAITRLVLDGERAWVGVDGGDGATPRAVAVADLRRQPGGAAPGRLPAGVLVEEDGRTLVVRARGGRARRVTLAAPIRAVVPGPGGTVLVAAWVTALDQPSVILVER
ncbi:MAG: hypothetical protein R2939_05030 [Kofleriaceae bacterium]